MVRLMKYLLYHLLMLGRTPINHLLGMSHGSRGRHVDCHVLLAEEFQDNMTALSEPFNLYLDYVSNVEVSSQLLN